jgi:hypothetical protein
MVLFYCTAVAMKRQDHHTSTVEGLEDFFDPGEKREFSGQAIHCVVIDSCTDIKLVRSLTGTIFMLSASLEM